MAEDKSDLDERITWKPGDLVVTGPDGKPIDLSKVTPEDEPEAVADGPTLHLYLPEEEGT